jgi:uncharacterized repeat protein (TIGR01451 family)
MKKINFFLATIFLTILSFKSQEPITKWQTSFGTSNIENTSELTPTLDGGFLVVGSASAMIDQNGNFDSIFIQNYGLSEGLVLKVDSNGDTVWHKYIGGSGEDYIASVELTNDGNYILAGHTSSNDGDVSGNNGYEDLWIVKMNPDGNIIWQKCIGGSLWELAYSIKPTSDGGFIILGNSASNDGDVSNNPYSPSQQIWLVKLDMNANVIWDRIVSGPTTGWEPNPSSVQETLDGGYIVGGSTNISTNNGALDIWVLKLDAVGNIIWEKSIGGSDNDQLFDLKQTSDGNFILSGYTTSSDGDFIGNVNGYYGVILKLDVIGNILWQKFLDYSLYRISQTTDGGFIASGEKITYFDSIGNEVWTKNTGFLTTSIKQVSSNELIVCGDLNINDNSGLNTDYWISKLKLVEVKGNVFNDISGNCILDSLELNLSSINFVVNPGNQIVTSNSYGEWYIDSLSTGTYTITIDTTNLNWTPTCPITQSFTVTNPNGFTDGPNFGLISTNPCSDPDVSIYAPFLRRCLSNQKVYVSACNQATATGVLNTSYVDVELDPFMIVTSASLPYTALGNNVFRFQTGNLNPGQCVDFNITTTISCNAMLGQTLCMDANLFPVQSCALDTVPSDPIVNDGTGGTLNGFPQTCTLPWDQSSLSVDGWCANDSIYFTITNTGEPGGGDMECYSPMWITVDGVVTYTDSIMIPGGQTITLAYPGDGATWILNAEQHPLHPGNSHPNAHVEACGDSTNWTPDNVNDFPQDDADPVVDIYCGVVTGSYDPNDKMGYPIGQTDQKYIQPNQQLQYVIRFQNTGTDTAFTVVIRDTLDTDLNIFTVTSGVSSHQYDFRMYGPRVLEWTFNNINLPDSTTDQEGSNGFVTFHVDQVPNLLPGTEITNEADIYFDFNDPITTNTAMHRIYEGFVSVLNIEDLAQEGKTLLVYPNPTSNNITIQGKEGMNQNFKIFDQMGRIVISGKLNGINTEVNLSTLSKGMYTLKIEGNYQPAQIVKE